MAKSTPRCCDILVRPLVISSTYDSCLLSNILSKYDCLAFLFFFFPCKTFDRFLRPVLSVQVRDISLKFISKPVSMNFFLILDSFWLIIRVVKVMMVLLGTE